MAYSQKLQVNRKCDHKAYRKGLEEDKVMTPKPPNPFSLFIYLYLFYAFYDLSVIICFPPSNNSVSIIFFLLLFCFVFFFSLLMAALLLVSLSQALILSKWEKMKNFLFFLLWERRTKLSHLSSSCWVLQWERKEIGKGVFGMEFVPKSLFLLSTSLFICQSLWKGKKTTFLCLFVSF